ncbi:MAG: non-canonical purine NTP pyrophosphatase [Leptothrix sp. (in: b-proteobacteria)]
MKLVLASNNAKKLKELAALFGTDAIELIGQGTLGVTEADEPHPTFVENALAKARHAAAATGLAAIADDSGLCVDALGGQPGVQSAVFASIDDVSDERRETREERRARQDAANNALLLQRLAGVDARHARFVCALVALRSADDPEPLIAFGRWNGEILRAAQGDGGFGYDPLMHLPALGATAAALPAEVKNAHSHRALAATHMRALMRDHWRIG